MQREDGGSVRLELEGPIFVLIEDWRRSQRRFRLGPTQYAS